MPAPRPPRRAHAPRPAHSPVRAPEPASDPVTDTQREALQDGFDRLPSPLEPLDVSALDGFLCGVLLQPQPIPEARWLAHVFDVDGRPVPAGLDVSDLRAVVRRRHRELDRAIEGRQWFDPWVFELDEEAAQAADDEGTQDESSEAVYPWVAGFATALTLFPALSDLADGAGPQAQAMVEPLALVYRHLDPDDLEDADALLAEIDTLEPPANLSESVEGLVRATLLLADLTRPRLRPAAPSRGPAPRPRGPRR
jgi:uncharacterized protein